MQVNFRGSMSPTLKALVIGFLVVVLMVPLSLLEGLVRERAGLREQAYARVAQGWGGPLTVGGPVIELPAEVRARTDAAHSTRESLYLLPSRLAVDLVTYQEADARRVGIYAVPVFMLDARMTGSFDLAAARKAIEARYPDHTLLWQDAVVCVPLADLRGLREVRSASVAQRDLVLVPGNRSIFREGLEAPLDTLSATTGPPIDFEFDVRIAGSRSLSVLPVGSVSRVAMESDWPHPAFNGAYLPAEHSISDDGFAARWQVLELNRTYGAIVSAGQVDPGVLEASALSVDFHQPADIYQRGERAIKYALLFIALTFMTIFAWEHVARVALHPLQYLLVGLALSIFYLLLIALSEHIAFGWAYWIAAIALVALVGFYLAGVLGNARRGSIAGAAVSAVYGICYVLVIAEDYALLMGSIVLFAALAVVMITTRRVNWYSAGSAVSPAE
jgi:inner membrane protein